MTSLLEIMMLKVFTYYTRYAKSHWIAGCLVFVVYMISLVLVTTIRPLYIKKIIDAMNLGPTDTALDVIMVSLGAILLLTVIAHVFFRAGDFLITWFQSKTLKNITDDCFWRLHKHSADFFQDNFVGSLVTKSRRFVRSFEASTDALIWNIWFPFVTVSGILIALLFIAPLLSGIFLVWTVFYVWVTWVFIKVKIPKDLAKARQDSVVTGLLADTLTNFLNLKMFSALSTEHSHFKDATEKEHDKRLHTWNFANLQDATQAILLGIVLEIGMMYAAIVLWREGSITVGSVVLVQAYMGSVFGQLWSLGKGLTKLAEAVSDAQEMIEIFETDLQVSDPPVPEESRISDGLIRFTQMDFFYNRGVQIFRNFDLTVRAGEKIGLVGHSGSGKSTIVKLLLRFNDVTDGSITIDGQNIAHITQDDLRRNISYVPQEPILFHRSLADNILYGSSRVTPQEMINAAKKAHAHEFITSLPDGYDTLVGERGIKLSGGERQRIVIARAMLKDAPILILDEATSALDSLSEKHIQKAFESLMEGRTTIVIAHRLSTIQKMDRIIVLESGKVIEDGSHKELVSKGGVYNTFWQEQAGGFIGD